jgi:hypothetical protein
MVRKSARTTRLPGDKVKLTTHLQLVQRLRMSEEVPPLPHMRSFFAQAQNSLYIYISVDLTQTLM